MTDNSVTIIGNITRDPELRFTPSNQSIATFGVAVNRRWQNRQTQEMEESTSFFDVVCWASLADNVSESLAKGARVIVTGRLEQRSWESQDGEKRSKIEIVADEVGPSLRWATARPQKTDRRPGGDQPTSAGRADSGRSAAGGQGGGPPPTGGPQSSYVPAAPPSYGADEEPF